MGKQTRDGLTCQTCGETFTPKQSKGHANMWGHYIFRDGSGNIINHSRYPHAA